MIMYGTSEDRSKAIRAEVERLRAAAGQIAKVKRIIKEFDGKIYNCRFDEAIKALSDESNYFYCCNHYGWFYIHHCYNHNYRDTTLLAGYSCKAQDKKQYMTVDSNKIFTDNKRIIADRMIEILNEKYNALLKQAADLERSLDEVQQVIQQVEHLQKMINGIIGSLPDFTIDTYNIKYYR